MQLWGRVLFLLRPDVHVARGQQGTLRLLLQHPAQLQRLRIGLQVPHLLQWLLPLPQQHLRPVLHHHLQLRTLLPEHHQLIRLVLRGL